MCVVWCVQFDVCSMMCVVVCLCCLVCSVKCLCFNVCDVLYVKCFAHFNFVSFYLLHILFCKFLFL